MSAATASGACLGFALALACGCARANDGTVAARAVTSAQALSAFARVEPVSLVRLNAARPGVVAGLRVLPGERVKADEPLAALQGPEIDALVAQGRDAVAAAQGQLAAARESRAAALQNERLRLTTHEAVADAQAKLVRARAALAAARARLSAAHKAVQLRAPVAGTVLTLAAADGERVSAGQTILTLQPAHGLWLKAAFYGRAGNKIHPGMTGRFIPADGDSAVAVRVRSEFGAMRPDGAREAGLVAVGAHPAWVNGEAGSVTLEGPTRTLASVPTRALILDQGRWWVLLRGARGEARREVTPGPSRGQWTLIEHGLEPGTRVVVENAYLEFHRAVARQYQPPD